MPVTTTISGTAPVFIDYRINVPIDYVKRAPRVRPWPAFSQFGSGGSGVVFPAITKIQKWNDNLVPNTSPSGTVLSPISSADTYGLRLAPMNNATTIVTTVGGYVNTVLFFSYSDVFPVAGTPGTEAPTNVYRIYVPDPTKMPKLCCIEADLGAPFGTIRLIYENGSLFFSAPTPPVGWVRNQERRNASGAASGDSFQVYATGSQVFNAYWMGVYCQDGTTWNRNGGFLDAAVPAFKLNFPQNSYPGFNSGLLHWNNQSNTLYTSNLTVTGRWRKVRHDDHGTYYPLPGAYLGSSFNIAFTDLNPTGTSPLLVLTWGQVLPAPTLPANEYCGLFLEISFTSDYIDAGGVVRTSTITPLNRSVNQSRGNSVPEFEYPYAPPSYWPWDIGQKGYGPDDASVRWVRHAGYRPVSFPPILPETTVAPVLSRVGKVIILQGGRPAYTGAVPNITASTPACTGLVFSTDSTQTNASQMQSSMTMRVTSMEWGAEWAGSDTLGEAPEYTATTGTTLTGVYRQVYSGNYLIGANYQGGPGVAMTDICALQNNVAGAQGNIAITTETGLVRGMQFGGAALPARGSIFLNANPTDTKKIVIGDGIITKTFEFDSNGSVVVGNVAVVIGASIDATNANLVAAINTSGLAITASVPTIADLMVEITLCRIVGQSGGFRRTSKRWTVAAP